MRTFGVGFCDANFLDVSHKSGPEEIDLEAIAFYLGARSLSEA
jgi:hypothetical protein